MGRGARDRMLARLRADVADLRRHTANLPARRPAPQPFGLKIDHQNHEASTAFRELGVGDPGHTHDLFKVVPVKSGSVTTQRLALSMMRSTQGGAKHNEGWVWGLTNEEGGTGGDVGWGPLADVLCIRGKDQSNVDIKSTAQFNTGQDTRPLKFDDGVDPVALNGPLVEGLMVPSLRYPEYYVPAVPVNLDIDDIDIEYQDYLGVCPDDDDCRLLVDPLRYQKTGTIRGFSDPTTSTVNYLEWIACNREDINDIFLLLWYVSCVFSCRVGNIDSNLQSAIAQGQSFDAYFQAVNLLLGALSGFHPSTAPLMNLVNITYGLIVWYSTHCSDGPVDSSGYDHPGALECAHFSA
jgi:hypothetical protein